MALLLVTSSFAKPAQSPEPVKVESGLLQGTVEDGLTIYRGIPYAAPPVGDLRWRAPQPAPILCHRCDPFITSFRRSTKSSHSPTGYVEYLEHKIAEHQGRLLKMRSSRRD